MGLGKKLVATMMWALGCESSHFGRARSLSNPPQMKQLTRIASAIAVLAFGSIAQSATIIGTINFSSGPNGGVILQDSAGNTTTNPALSTGVQSWLVPQVNTRSGSFISVPNGQAVTFSQPWIFDPTTPMTPLWTIVGSGNFTFTLVSSTIVSRDSDFLLVEGIGTLTGTDFDATPATWYFSAQGPATEGKFSWSSTTTAVPEAGSATLLGGALLSFCFFRRRNLS